MTWRGVSTPSLPVTMAPPQTQRAFPEVVLRPRGGRRDSRDGATVNMQASPMPSSMTMGTPLPVNFRRRFSDLLPIGCNYTSLRLMLIVTENFV